MIILLVLRCQCENCIMIMITMRTMCIIWENMYVFHIYGLIIYFFKKCSFVSFILLVPDSEHTITMTEPREEPIASFFLSPQHLPILYFSFSSPFYCSTYVWYDVTLFSEREWKIRGKSFSLVFILASLSSSLACTVPVTKGLLCCCRKDTVDDDPYYSSFTYFCREERARRDSESDCVRTYMSSVPLSWRWSSFI